MTVALSIFGAVPGLSFIQIFRGNAVVYHCWLQRKLLFVLFCLTYVVQEVFGSEKSASEESSSLVWSYMNRKDEVYDCWPVGWDWLSARSQFGKQMTIEYQNPTLLYNTFTAWELVKEDLDCTFLRSWNNSKGNFTHLSRNRICASEKSECLDITGIIRSLAIYQSSGIPRMRRKQEV